MTTPGYQIGLEEEYFIVDRRTRNVRPTMPKQFFRACKRELKDHVTNEMLQLQIEVMTSPCRSIAAVREEVAGLRRAVAEQAQRHQLAIVAAATHPLAVWREQKLSVKDRYTKMTQDIQITARRSMVCGMHVHVEVPAPARRVELMVRMLPFLPLFLALSTSSPFWQGRPTGLNGYRLAAHDEMPRSGLPDLFGSTAEYQGYVGALTKAGIIPDASHIWWDIRPSRDHPTLELRIPDVCTRLEDAVCLAAIYRCLTRHLTEHPDINAGLDAVDRAFAQENKWRAQRYGTSATFIDRRTMTVTSAAAAVADLLALLHEDAQALDCVAEVAHAHTILARGSSAARQLSVYAQARLAGRGQAEALKEVVDWLIAATVAFDAPEGGSCEGNVEPGEPQRAQ